MEQVVHAEYARYRICATGFSPSTRSKATSKSCGVQPLVRGGKVVEGQDLTDVHAAKARCRAQLACLDASVKRFYNPHRYPAGLEKGLHAKRDAMIRELRGEDMY